MRRLSLLLLIGLAGCGQHRGHAEARALIAERCAACHVVPGVAGANGRVGPSLAGIAGQQIIAGHFVNNRINLARWVAHPQKSLPGNAMPDTGLTDRQALAIADYLATLD
ncbi:MAG: cytochrome c class [Alphaproteobacteria bacterium]|nr:cytochrome c class [Alphaproteobacteria bacterium]